MTARIIQPTHGTDGAMGYKYRARIQQKTGYIGWPWKRREVTLYRYLIEQYFMSWKYFDSSHWQQCSREEVERQANQWLDRRNTPPRGDLVEYPSE